MIPPRSPFIWGDAGQAMTPEQVARRRAMAAALSQDSTSTAPVASWTQAAARGLGGYLSGRSEKIATRAENEGMAGADAAIQGNPVLSALMGGGQMVTPPVPQVGVDPGIAPSFSGAAPAMQQEARSAPGADAIRAGLVQRGLAPHVADAFVMNFQDESGLNPGIEEHVANVHGTKGFGLAQWTGPRRDALTQFAQSQGRPVSDVDTQLDFLMTELQGSEKGAAQSILGAQDTGSAAAAIVNRFLRPAEQHRARREAEYTGGMASPGMSGGVAGNTPQAPSGVVAALIGAQQNPWVAQKYGPVIDALMQQEMGRQDQSYQQQLQQSDPMYQAQLQGAQLANQAAMQPQQAKPIEVGGVLLDPNTYQPIFDSREPDAYTLGPGQQRFGPDGQVIAEGPPAQPGVVVNNMPGQDKFDEAFASGDAATMATISDAGLQATRNMGRIDQLESALNSSPSGAEAIFKQALGERGIQTDGLDSIQAAQALINSMVPEQRQPGSGPMSDADLALFKQSLPRLVNSAGGNQQIIGAMRGIAQYDAAGAQIVQQVRAGEMTRAEGMAALQARPNPLETFKATSADAAPVPTAGAQIVPDAPGAAPDFSAMTDEQLQQWLAENE